MAWSIAVNFSSFPILASSYKELKPKTSSYCEGSSLWSSRKSFRVFSSACIRKCATPQSPDCSRLIRVLPRDIIELFPSHSDVRYCPRTLSGYWVGPDCEDGWGFVEAYIDEKL